MSKYESSETKYSRKKCFRWILPARMYEYILSLYLFFPICTHASIYACTCTCIISLYGHIHILHRKIMLKTKALPLEYQGCLRCVPEHHTSQSFALWDKPFQNISDRTRHLKKRTLKQYKLFNVNLLIKAIPWGDIKYNQPHNFCAQGMVDKCEWHRYDVKSP